MEYPVCRHGRIFQGVVEHCSDCAMIVKPHLLNHMRHLNTVNHVRQAAVFANLPCMPVKRF
jgi:hypothetical protein